MRSNHFSVNPFTRSHREIVVFVSHFLGMKLLLHKYTRCASFACVRPADNYPSDLSTNKRARAHYYITHEIRRLAPLLADVRHAGPGLIARIDAGFRAGSYRAIDDALYELRILAHK